MKKTFYELRSNAAEIRGEASKSIYHGCVYDALLNRCADCGGELIARYESKEDALSALANHETFIREYGHHFFLVKEFYIEENAYEIDEDGDEEWIDGGGIYAYGVMPAELIHDSQVYRWNEQLDRYEKT